MASSFEIEIENQHWLGEPREQSHDGCSHGGIRALIGGRTVTADDPEYGISQSALSLLRTVEQNHSPSDPVSAGYLLCHGCGYPTHFGCGNFGTDWIVRHEGDVVVLSQPRHVDAFAGETHFDVQARVPIDQYRRQIVTFAQEVRDFFAGSEPRELEEWEQEFHDQFWAEFEGRLTRAEAPAAH